MALAWDAIRGIFSLSFQVMFPFPWTSVFTNWQGFVTGLSPLSLSTYILLNSPREPQWSPSKHGTQAGDLDCQGLKQYRQRLHTSWFWSFSPWMGLFFLDPYALSPWISVSGSTVLAQPPFSLPYPLLPTPSPSSTQQPGSCSTCKEDPFR